jgi:hypothetical protein
VNDKLWGIEVRVGETYSHLGLLQTPHEAACIWCGLWTRGSAALLNEYSCRGPKDEDVPREALEVVP